MVTELIKNAAKCNVAKKKLDINVFVNSNFNNQANNTGKLFNLSETLTVELC